MLRYLTAGESHGQALVAVLEGLPAGVPLTSGELARELARRRLGYGRGKRMRFDEARPVLERASARETAARVAAGAAAKALLGQVGVAVLSHVVRLGPAATRSRAVPTLADLEEIDASPVRCLDGEAEGRMAAAVDAAKAAGDTLGGGFEGVAHGLPPRLGSYVHWGRKLDAPLVRALDTVDVATGAKAKAVVQRSDVTAVPAAGVVGEAVVALVLADALLEKTGGDSLAEVRRNLDAYLSGLDPQGPGAPHDP